MFYPQLKRFNRTFKLRQVIFFIIFSGLVSFSPALLAQDVNEESAYFTHLQQVYFENQDHQYDAYLLPRLTWYDILFPNSPQLDQVNFILADLLRQQGKRYPAFFYFSKLIFLHPSSKLQKDALAKIHVLLPALTELHIVERSDSIEAVLNRQPPASSPEEGYFNFLSFVYSLRSDSLEEHLIEGIHHYRLRFGVNAQYNDILLFWESKLFSKKGAPKTASALLRELIALYPGSEIIPKALLNLALIEDKVFKNYDKTRDLLLSVVNNYPEASESAQAQFLLARVYEIDLHKPDLAIENYRLVVEAFSQSAKRCQALFRLGDLLYEQNDYTGAVQAYMQYYEECADSVAAIQALQKVAEISDQQFHDLERLAGTLLLLANHSANDSTAAEYLYRVAEIYAGMPDQKNKAQKACQLILKEYKHSPVAEKAARLLQKISE